MDEEHLKKWLDKRKERREQFNASDLLREISLFKMSALSTAITLLESTRVDDQKIANELINLAIPYAGKSIRIGITGVPGVGKSTFIESFGKVILAQGKRLAVLAIDPSSEFSGGSILGDKTRMEELSMMNNVFIRPSPAGKTLGGVARKTRESIILCEAAGYDVILIETVGVGQSETMVHSMVDFFLLLMLSGAGDELQGIKRGIMEMADSLVITKADGDNIHKSKLARKEYQNAMHLFPPNPNGWIAKALTCSSLSNDNIKDVWETIVSYENHTKLNNWFDKKRHQQDKFWFHETLKELILNQFFNNEINHNAIHKAEQDVIEGKISSFQAAEKIYQKYIQK
ncbi:MAG: methylmalonyl Co-A mutase-associated GTPase MeaB [Flavobacteriia bacterium]|nr:methylmalonyl Co-A mutase-associated GTPase MeaB [Flavobacteriia bacterium]